MKKIEKRAIMCLLLGLVLIVGVGIFSYRFVKDGDDWASYEGNRDVYARGDLSKGALYDADGKLLMQNTENGMVFNEDPGVRKALMHVTGDRDNNISTGANRAFTDEMIGYDLINGIYSLNNSGKDINLTLDADVCKTAYQAMDGRKGAVGVYNYKTGEIICMVSSPTYDPKSPPKLSSTDKSGVYVNRFTSATFTPGSVFKLVTAAAAIETLDDAYTYTVKCTGHEDYGHGDRVTDLSAHGTVDLRKALEVSCNIYFGKLAEKVGGKTIEKYTKKLGLTESMDINGIHTAAGSFDYPDGGVNLAWTGIGQYKDLLNPCAMMVYMGAIANDGKAVMPSIVKPTTFMDRQMAKLPKFGTKTSTMIDSTTATSLKDMMSNNVTSHYGRGMFPGLNVCAKTGTAEVGKSNKPHSWMTGFLDDPQHPYAFAVLVENGGYGATAAGSVANKVLQSAVSQ